MLSLDPFASRSRKRLGAITLVLCLLVPASGMAQSLPDLDRMSSMLTLMQSFYALMDRVHAMAESPQKSALLQMHEIEEIYKKRGEHQKAVPVYRDVLAKTHDPVVRALAYMKLADVLKQTGQQDAAIEVLREALDESLARAARSD